MVSHPYPLFFCQKKEISQQFLSYSDCRYIADTCNLELVPIKYGYHLTKNKFTTHQVAATVAMAVPGSSQWVEKPGLGWLRPHR